MPPVLGDLATARAVAAATAAAVAATTDPNYAEVEVPTCLERDKETCQWAAKARGLENRTKDNLVDTPDYYVHGLIPRDELLNILAREEELRMCDGIQDLYDRFKFPPPDIELELQAAALSEHGYCRCFLTQYWRTSYRFPDDQVSGLVKKKLIFVYHVDLSFEQGAKKQSCLPSLL